MPTNRYMTIPNDVYVDGVFSARSFDPPAGSIRDSGIYATAGIAATKLQQQYILTYYQAPGTAIVAATIPLYIVRGLTGLLVQLDSAIVGAIATGGDRTVTVDLKKGNASTSYATMLSAVTSFSSSDALRTPKQPSGFSATSLAVADSLQLVVAVAGAAGNQAQGLLVTLTVREDPS